MKWPAKIKKPRTYPHTVSLVDLKATFAELTGQKIIDRNTAAGHSFYNVLEGYRIPIRDHVVYISSSGTLTIKKSNWKFIDSLGSVSFTQPTRLTPVTGGPQSKL